MDFLDRKRRIKKEARIRKLLINYKVLESYAQGVVDESQLKL